MLVYTDSSHYSVQYRNELFDFLKAFFNDLSPEERSKSYGAWTKSVIFTDDPRRAALAVLPMSWNFYLKNGKVALAMDFIRKASSCRLVSWVNSDFGVPVLYREGEIFRASGYQSRRLPGQWAMPPFFMDPLERIYSRTSIFPRKKIEKPTVGFCGQAGGTWMKYAVDIARIAGRNTAFYTKLRVDEPQAILSAAWLRNKALDLLEGEPGVETRFIRRYKYRAGARDRKEAEQTTLEFFDNIQGTDYTLCVRGGGNFSVRLYETLAMGRIPVFIDTDSILPWDDIIPWKEIMVYVPIKDLRCLPQILLDFHNEIHPDDFVEQQQKARKLWLEHLSFAGFFKTFIEKYSFGMHEQEN
ncbi:MAG: exostosin family protein [Cyclobacteriaceae bacterium]|nr:exostosin family protein [Cyclobacteriaceae bacterium]